MLNATHAVRLGSIAAGVAWLVLLFAPGSRGNAISSRPPDLAAASEAGPATLSPPSTTTVPTTTVVSTTVVASTAPPPTPAPTKPAGPTPGGPTTVPAPVFSVRDIVGIRIDRTTSWIAIATVQIVDQTGLPAAGVEVKATWSFGPTPTSCSTDNTGKCSMYQSSLPPTVDAATITMAPPLSGSKTVSRNGIN